MELKPQKINRNESLSEDIMVSGYQVGLSEIAATGTMENEGILSENEDSEANAFINYRKINILKLKPFRTKGN